MFNVNAMSTSDAKVNPTRAIVMQVIGDRNIIDHFLISVLQKR